MLDEKQLLRLKRKAKQKEASIFWLQRHVAELKGLPADFTPEQWQECLNWFNGCCAYCGAQQSLLDGVLHQDHYISKTLRGGYTATNIVPACKTCNVSKKNRHPEEWVKWKFPREAKKILARVVSYFEWVKSQ